MFEIDIDIRWFIALDGNETLKHHIDAFRRNGGDPQNKTDHRIGRRATPLTQYAFAPCEFYDVINGQEIGGVIQLFDNGQFPLDKCHYFFRYASWKMNGDFLGDEFFQLDLWFLAVGNFVRIFIF